MRALRLLSPRAAPGGGAAYQQNNLQNEQKLSELQTEASLISTPLLLSLGWRIRWREMVLIRGVPFERFNLSKALKPILN